MTQAFVRTDHCGALRKENVGKLVSLSGWVSRRRDHGGLIFIDLRDRFGITQLIFDPQIEKKAYQIAERLRSEWVINAKGKVRPRAPGMANPNLITGDIEVEITQITILSEANTPPFSIVDETIQVNEELRLKYRYLDMRRGPLIDHLLLRHKMNLTIRNFLDTVGFTEVATPLLGKSTPEGARDYLVPSRIYPGEFYALPQSPQLFKQILMIGNLDRYFQIASCFRDEDLRADRQPEFTQLDMEMSFSTPDMLFEVIETLMKKLFHDLLDITLTTPFPRNTYQDCIEYYGTDKPDFRFGMPLFRIDEIAQASTFSIFQEVLANKGIVKGICVPEGSRLSRKQIEEYAQFVSRLGIKGLSWVKYTEEGFTSPIAKFLSPSLQEKLIEKADMKVGDLLFIIADNPHLCHQALDHLRRKVAADLNLIPSDQYAFSWVIDFPLFIQNPETGDIESTHHPFTSPLLEDLPLLDTDLLQVRSSSYDLVLNGYELGSGSQRIFCQNLQRKIFELLQLTPEEIKNKFGFFVEALSFGTPPHLGIALGLDRIAMLMSGTDNIRDVIAFPKTQKAKDLMMDSPSEVAQGQLKELKIKVEK